MPNINYGAGQARDTLVSGTVTASGSSAPVAGFAGRDQLVVQADVTAASGTSPTLDLVLEDTVDGTNWNQVAAFTQVTAIGRQVLRVSTPFTDQLRVRHTVGGTTPSFTFSVQVYSETS